MGSKGNVGWTPTHRQGVAPEVEILCGFGRSSRGRAVNLSDGWLSSFKEWNELKSFKHHGEAASAKIEDVEVECEQIKVICADYALKDIYNMDETGLFYR